MPPQKTQSLLMKKLGNRMASIDKAVRDHANDEVKLGNQQLPPGIKNGRARIVKCGFGEIQAGKENAGAPFFRVAAVIVSPTSVVYKGAVVNVRGLQTSIMETVADTKTKSGPNQGKVTTAEMHCISIENTLKSFGVPAAVFAKGGAALEEAAAMVEAAKPIIKFETSERKAQKEGDEPGVWENWFGVDADYVEGQAGAGAGVQDDTAAPPSANGDGHGADAPFNEFAGQDAELGEDLDAIAVDADAGDDGAQTKLEEMAKEKGYDEDTIKGATDWSAVVEMIRQADEPAADDAPAEPEEPAAPEWAKGDPCSYRAPDPKNPKKAGKPQRCEVVAVNKAKGLCDLKNASNPKLVYKAVAIDKLEAV